MIITRQEVHVHKPGIEDDWGRVTYLPPIKLRCRANEKTAVVKNRMGEEVVASVELMFRGLPNITYEDEVEYTNEVGTRIKRRPELIEPARGISGKPEWTGVYL